MFKTARLLALVIISSAFGLASAHVSAAGRPTGADIQGTALHARSLAHAQDGGIAGGGMLVHMQGGGIAGGGMLAHAQGGGIAGGSVLGTSAS